MRQQLAEIEAIAEQTGAADVRRTRSWRWSAPAQLLTRVAQGVLRRVTGANTNDTLQKVQDDRGAEARGAQRRDLPERQAVRARARRSTIARDELGSTPEQKRARRALPPRLRPRRRAAVRCRQDALRALNEEESKLTTRFQNKLLAAHEGRRARRRRQVASSPASSEARSPRRREAAKERKLAGKWVLALQNTTQQPAQASLDEPRGARAAVRGVVDRAEHGDANDTRATIARLAQLRAEQAKLLGYPTLRRVRARRPDGEDARDRDQAADRHRAGRRPRRRAAKRPTCRR